MRGAPAEQLRGRSDDALGEPLREPYSQPPRALIDNVFRQVIFVGYLLRALLADHIFVHDCAVFPVAANVREQLLDDLVLLAARGRGFGLRPRGGRGLDQGPLIRVGVGRRLTRVPRFIAAYAPDSVYHLAGRDARYEARKLALPAPQRQPSINLKDHARDNVVR